MKKIDTQLIKNILAAYHGDMQQFEELIANYIAKRGKFLTYDVQHIENSNGISFEDTLLYAEFYSILYRISDNSFCYYSSAWVLSTCFCAYQKADIDEHKISVLKLLYSCLDYAFHNKKQFTIGGFYDGIDKTAILYDNFLISRAFERVIPEPPMLYLLFRTLQKLLSYYAKFGVTDWDVISAGHTFGEVCSIFKKYNLTDYATLKELIDTSLASVGPLTDDPDFIASSECSYDIISKQLYQDLSDDAIRYLDFLHPE